MKLRNGFKGTLYIYQNIEYDFMTIHRLEVNDNPEMVLLGTRDVDWSFDVSREDATKQVVAGLKEEKKRVQAETQLKLNQIDDQINGLLAITHEAEL